MTLTNFVRLFLFQLFEDKWFRFKFLQFEFQKSKVKLIYSIPKMKSFPRFSLSPFFVDEAAV